MQVLKIILVATILIILLILANGLFINFLNSESSVKNNILSALDKDNLKLSQANANNALSNVNYALITQKNIFGNLSNNQEDKDVESSRPSSDIPLALIGTVITTGSAPYAIIENTKENLQDAFSTGDSVFELATLVAIYKNKVEIRRNGIIETLEIDAFDSDGQDDEQSGNILYLDAKEVQAALSNLPEVMTHARAIPYWQEGQAVGVRLFSIKQGSIFEKVGLKNGDILKNINGKQLGDFSKAMGLFEELKNETSLSINLERNKEEMNLHYKIR
ncbi:MAG: type II secretion system protein N [Bdellovibrionota bacterium]